MAIQTATNPQTGETVALVDGRWVPVGQTATNDQGQKAYLVNNQWLTDEPAKKEIPERTYGEAATDIGAKLVSGLGSLIQQPGQLVGLATGAIKDKDFSTTGAQGVGKDMQEWAKERTSKALLAKEAETARLAAEAEKNGGQWAAFKSQAGSMLSDPAQLTAFLAEQTPQAIPSIIAALIPGAGPAILAELRAAQVAAKSATTVAAKEAAELAVAETLKKATASQVARGAAAAKGVGAVQQGADIGGGSYEEIYKNLVESGMPEADAANKALNLARAAGVGGGALSLLAAKLPGAQAFERALAGERIGVKGVLGKAAAIGAGALKEIPGEEIEEVGGKFLQNLAMQQVDPEQSLTSGLGVTAAQAAVGAAGMGGVGGALSGRQSPETETQPSLPAVSSVNSTPEVAPPSQTQVIEDQAAELERKQQRQEAAMERARAGGIGGGSEVNQTLLEQARIRREQQERAAVAEEKAAEAERKKELRAERVHIGSTQYSGDPMMNEVLRSRAIAEFDAANAPKVEAPKAPEYQPTKTIEQVEPIAQPEGFNVLRGVDSRGTDFMSAVAERRAAEEAAAAAQTKQVEAQKTEQAAKTDASRADVDQRVAQVENFLMSPVKKTQQETADYMAGVVPEMQKDFLALLDEDMSQPLTPEQTQALKTQIRQRIQPEIAPKEAVQRTPFKKFLASKGMNKKDVQDIFGESAYRANQQLPGAIRADAPRLDMLAEAAVEAGFLQEEDTEALTQMIKDEFGGDEQVAVDMADDRAAAEYEAQREGELQSRADAIGLKTKGMKPEQIAARLDRIERKREEKRRQYNRTIDGFADLPTEDQDRIIDMMIDQFGEPQVFDVERAEIEGRVRDEEVLGQEPMFTAEAGRGYNISAEDQRIEKELTGKSMIQAADWTVANAPNAFAKVIAEKTRNRLREFQRKGMTLEFNISGGSSRLRMLSGARGVTQFEWGKDDKGTKISVTLNGAAVMDNQAGYPPGVQYNTILHELLHVATRSQFVFMPGTDPLKKQMTELFNTVVGRFNADAKAGTLPPVMEKYYKRMNNVLEDTDELLAWGLTDKDVQTYLDDIKVGDKSVFTRLIELIRTALGLGKPYESALERLVRTSESLLDVDVDAIDAMLGQRDKQIGVKKKPSGPMVQESLFQREGAPAKAPPTDSAAFKKWFGDSKVVDESGEPLVVYHGTFVRPMGDGTDMGDITAFDRMFTTKFRRPSIDTVGSWFSTNPGEGGAEMYSGKDQGAAIYPVYLSIKNPQVTTFQLMTSRARKLHNGKDDGRQIGSEEVAAYRAWLKSMGKDGIKIEASGNEGSTEFDNQVAWIALEPTQIKSATGNIGTYDPTNPDIRYQREAKSNPNQAAQANLDILDATGMQLQPPEPGRIQSIKNALRKMGEDPALTKDSAKSSIKKFLDKMEVAAFSGDAAFNNDIRRNLEADFADNPKVLGMLLEASQSQAVHADALATQFIVDGGIAFDPATKKWVSIKKEDNFIKLAKQIEKAAEKYGLNKEQTEQIAHTYFVAKRFKDLLKKQNARDADTDRLKAELEAENANIKQYKKEGDFEKLRTSERAKNDIKADIAKLEKAKVLISEDQRAMIEPGLSLVKNMPELEDISDTWQGIRANAVKAMIDGNLWSMKYAEDMLDNAAYVPFYRDEQLDEGGGPQEFIKGMEVKAAEFRLKGSNAAVNDVFDNMVRWTQYAINRSVRNHKALQMVNIGTELQVGDRRMAELVDKMDPKKNTIRVFRDGTQEIYSMADPLYVDAFSAISNVTIPSLKFFTWFSNILRQSVVLYPLFSVAQVPQDAISAMFTSGLKTRYALRIPVLAVKEFLKTLNKTSATHNLLKTYGATGVRDFNATVARNDIQIAAGLKGAKTFGGKGVEMLSHVAMAADNAIRQAVYEASMQQGLSKGEAIEKAFDIINFRRRGTSKLVNLAGQTVPFFYAYMSVQRTAYKTLTLVGISPQKRQEALNTLATTSGAVMALSLFYVMMNGGDEEYEKTPTATRDRTLNIPGTGGLRIPLRPDLFLMPKVLTEHLYHLITDAGLSDGEKFRKSVADGVVNAVLSPQPIPQAVKPAIEVAINYDFFQGRPLIGQFEKQKEAERQFNDNTSEFSKMLGEFGVSPIAADHVIRGMFGSAGGLFLYTTNFMINSDPDVPRPELSFRDAMSALPGTSGFVTKASENALKTDFYALRDEVEKVKNTYNDIKLRSPQELDQFLSDEKNIARLGLAKGTEKIGMQLSKIRRAINQITNAPEDLYSASEKKDAIKELRDVEKEMLKSVDIPALRKMAMM